MKKTPTDRPSRPTLESTHFFSKGIASPNTQNFLSARLVARCTSQAGISPANHAPIGRERCEGLQGRLQVLRGEKEAGETSPEVSFWMEIT